MANFQYTFSDGSSMDIAMPNYTTWTQSNCKHQKTPTPSQQDFSSQLLAYATNESNLNDREVYLDAIKPLMESWQNDAEAIKETWRAKEKDCDDWDAWWRVEKCNCCSRWCYMKENELRASYNLWRVLVDSINEDLKALVQLKIDTTTQIAIDNQQAVDQAMLDQLIAEVNQTISLTAYNNEARELDIQGKKTSAIFLPIIIGLIVLGMGFYLYKK
tara:strand:+ start:208 stop:855 length:648 start_codon:yes stop_codon:yes gene_type:complete